MKGSALARLFACGQAAEALREKAELKSLQVCVTSGGVSAHIAVKRYHGAAMQGRALRAERISCFVRNTLKALGALCADLPE